MSPASLIEIHGLGIGLVLFGLVFWFAIATALGRLGAARWPAALLGLPIVLSGVGVSCFWLFFFSSPENAVIAQATRSTVRHMASGPLTALGVLWFLASLALIVRAARRAKA
jgi:hypothetical protein